MVNEATLEARISSVLSTVFPTFKDVGVEHQKSFSIKFGHHDVSVDLTDPSSHPSRAIFDVLLTIDGKNVILLELKREGLKLTQEDVDQGISYARLIHPMPPITLISNGKDNWFYNSYTKEKIDTTNINFQDIQKIIDNSFQLAANDFKESIKILLNNDPGLFSKVINQISENKFNRLSGELNDFGKPICKEFSIDRELIIEIQSIIAQGVPLIGVIGSAFSGKTNLLYQFFMKTKSDINFLLYVDCSDHNYSILQQLANYFTENSQILITKDKIREWLINSISNNNDSKFYLLIDNFNNDIPEIIKSEIIEMIDIFKGINHHTLYSTDEFNYKKMAFVDNRQYKTIIGEQSKILKLNEFSDGEYKLIEDFLYKKYRVKIEHGGHYTPEYREPRIVRHLASIHSKDDLKEGQYAKIIAVPDLDLLRMLSGNKTYTNYVHNIYKKITFCFLAEIEARKNNSDLNIAASGSGAISTDIFKKNFPNDYEALIKSSFIVLRQLSNGQNVIYPKIPELIAIHSIDFIKEILLKEKVQGKTIEQICQSLVEIVTPIPYCDIVATGVLLNIASKENIELFSELVQKLLEIPPKFKRIEKGTKAMMFYEDIGHVQVNFDDGIDEGGFISDLLPYVILSQLAGYPLSLIDNDQYSEYAFQLTLLKQLGSSQYFLRRADARSLKNIKPLEQYDWDGIGHIISGHEGIVEPIVQSIQKCYIEIPQEIEKLYNWAFKENNFPLVWRIYLALRTMTNYGDQNLARQAQEFIIRFNEYFKIFIANFLSSKIENQNERDRLKEIILKFKPE